MPDDLITRVRAAITETMRIAWEATPGPWVVHWQYGEVGVDIEPADRIGRYVVCPDPAAGLVEADARHIALHNPKDIIRRCEADLRTLARHAPDGPVVIDERGDPVVWCLYCGRTWPCPDVLDRADVYGVSVEQPEPTP